MSPGGPDVKAIFTAALEIPEGPERDAYLAAARGDDSGLRRRVDDLLAALERASDVLGPSGTPAAAIADEAPGTSEPAQGADREATDARADATDSRPRIDHGPETAPGEPGTTAALDDRGSGRDGDALAPGTALRYFGDYEIRRELGRGGMGVVYEARQISLNRPVALKMVKAGLLAGDDELRRFQNEAEAFALLDHPGIVPVYEVGEHNGQRYFSMKLVSGGSLVRLLDRFKDDPKAAARLVGEVAEAVAHAHARGILHRDLKPANILVDQEGHPHVTDFGLAKKVQADVEFTASGAILGTPAYMAPEQATGRRGSITTATDVYGLGAVLYALLTGKAPFGGDSVVETLEAVRNTQPQSPTKLNVQLPRDLETICLKCLEKDPRRRYPTAQALADDLRAWLEARPIAARRVGPAERAWLWCKRKPAVASLSAAAALALIGGTIATIVVQARANAALRRMNDQLAAEERKVRERFELAQQAIRTFHTGVSEDFLLREPQFKALRDRLLKSASDFYDKLGSMLKDEADLPSRRALLQSNFEVAELTRKVGRIENALAAHRKVLAGREALAADPAAGSRSRVEMARSLLAVGEVLDATGKETEALTCYERAGAAVLAPDGSTPSDPTARAALAASEYAQGRLLQSQVKMAESLASLEHARALQDDLASADPANNDLQRERARIYSAIGYALLNKDEPEPEAALTDYRAALSVRQKVCDSDPYAASPRHDLGWAHANLGDLFLMTNKMPEAVAEYRKALAIIQKLVEDNPAVTRFRSFLGRCHERLGEALGLSDKHPEAETELRKALALFQELIEKDPRDKEHLQAIGASHYFLYSLLNRMGRLAEEIAEHRKLATTFEKLAVDNPAVPEFRQNQAGIHSLLGSRLLDSGESLEAEAEIRQAISLDQKLVNDNPSAAVFRDMLALHHWQLGDLLEKIGKLPEAEAAHRKALAIRQKLAEGNPGVVWDGTQQPRYGRDAIIYHERVGESLAALGRLTARAGRNNEAIDFYIREKEVLQKLVDATSSREGRQLGDKDYAVSVGVGVRDALASCQINTVNLLQKVGKPAEARAECERALTLLEPLVKAHPDNIVYLGRLAEAYLRSGQLLRDAGDLAGAASAWKRAVRLFDRVRSSRYVQHWEPSQMFLLAGCHAELSALAVRPASDLQAKEGPVELDHAMNWLRQAVASAYRDADAYRTETALIPLRNREDFQLLMLDLAMPADPFARGR
jgi:tetratricopeptide (TPR) repeat protein